MPKAKISARGGAKRWRTKSLPGGKYMHMAVVPKAGPRGGHTISGEVHKKKSFSQMARRRGKRQIY